VNDKAALIIYDGDCIFCQSYVRLLRLRTTIGDVQMLDARSGDPRVNMFWQKGYDLNEGMLFIYKDNIHYGSDAVHVLAALSSPVTWFNSLNRAIFSNRTATTLLYPLLKLGRRVVLFIRGKSLISPPLGVK
jgi:predicted DCC family thiol-disulfide oxidoreductase YuxK